MRFILLLGLVFFVACAPARLDRSRLSNGNAIVLFTPDRNEGGVYKLGEQVRFDLTLSRPGYITLISYEPTNNVVPFEINVKLAAGKQVFPRPEDRQGNAQAAYLIVRPTGTNRVLAIYSDVPLNPIPRGIREQSALETALRATLETSKATVFDLAETAIEVTP